MLVGQAGAAVGPALKTSAWLAPLYRAVFAGARAASRSAAFEGVIANVMGLVFEYNHPQSRGTVRLAGPDPHAPPVVDPGFLTDPSDVAAMVEVLRRLRDVLRTPPFSRYVGELLHMPGVHVEGRGPFGLLPGKGNAPFFAATDAQLAELVRARATTTWHYSCTARMGPPGASPSEAALDPRLRVKGVTGLRVADCSVAPFVVSANTNASAMMIGDKCGEIMSEDWGLQTEEGGAAALRARM
jgi:choline dehydrogenase